MRSKITQSPLRSGRCENGRVDKIVRDGRLESGLYGNSNGLSKAGIHLYQWYS